MNNISIFISAGEASGDLHGAHIVNELKKNNKIISFSAMGGKQLQDAGCQIIADYNQVSVVGITEVIKRLPDIRKAYKKIKSYLILNKPNFVILIDFPGFNLLLAKCAKKLGIKVIYYIPPQLWAWKEGRIKKIKKYVDYVFVIYPFEVEFYKKHKVAAFYKKNPLLNEIIPELDREAFCKKYHLEPSQPIIGIAPGSRINEIENIFETIIEAAVLIKKSEPNAQFILPIAPNFNKSFLENNLKNYLSLDIKLIEHDRVNVFFNSDIFIAVSGTVTVEIALARKPCIVVYKVSKFTYWLGCLLVKVKFISLLNIIRNKQIFPEFIQLDAQPEKIANEVLSILKNPYRYGEILMELDAFKKELESYDQNFSLNEAIIQGAKKIM